MSNHNNTQITALPSKSDIMRLFEKQKFGLYDTVKFSFA